MQQGGQQLPDTGTGPPDSIRSIVAALQQNTAANQEGGILNQGVLLEMLQKGIRHDLMPFPIGAGTDHPVFGILGNIAAADDTLSALCANAGYLPPSQQYLEGARAMLMVERGATNRPLAFATPPETESMPFNVLVTCAMHLVHFGHGHFLLPPVPVKVPESQHWNKITKSRTVQAVTAPASPVPLIASGAGGHADHTRKRTDQTENTSDKKRRKRHRDRSAQNSPQLDISIHQDPTARPRSSGSRVANDPVDSAPHNTATNQAAPSELADFHPVNQVLTLVPPKGYLADLAELAAFIQHNNLDNQVASELRQLPPLEQTEVIREGPCRNTRSPSATVTARIRKATGYVKVRGQRTGGTSTEAALALTRPVVQLLQTITEPPAWVRPPPEPRATGPKDLERDALRDGRTFNRQVSLSSDHLEADYRRDPSISLSTGAKTPDDARTRATSPTRKRRQRTAPSSDRSAQRSRRRSRSPTDNRSADHAPSASQEKRAADKRTAHLRPPGFHCAGSMPAMMPQPSNMPPPLANPRRKSNRPVTPPRLEIPTPKASTGAHQPDARSRQHPEPTPNTDRQAAPTTAHTDAACSGSTWTQVPAEPRTTTDTGRTATSSSTKWT